MRKIVCPLLFLFIIFSCQKDFQQPGFTVKVRAELQKRLSPGIFESLCFDSTSSTIEQDQHYFRVGFRNEPFAQHFVLLRVNESGSILSGQLVSMQTTIENSECNGNIVVTGLDGKLMVENPIRNGFIQKKQLLRDMILPGDVGSSLPEVILVSTYSSNVNTLLAYYSLAGFSGYTSAGNTYSTSKPATTVNPDKTDHVTGAATSTSTIRVDFESAQTKSGIDLLAYLRCFTAVPDAGAQCSIEILSDIPVDGHPEDLFNWNEGSPGHSFIRLQKTDGTNSVVQFIGFYPDLAWKSLSTAPVVSKFVDNGGHEFNASLKMNLTATQLQAVINEIARRRNDKYDIDEYNCTDWALAIFNLQRANKLTIAKYSLPGGQTRSGTSTPQALYQELKSIRILGGADAPNVNIPGVKGYVASSKGPC
jgi:hypothetical protein